MTLRTIKQISLLKMMQKYSASVSKLNPTALEQIFQHEQVGFILGLIRYLQTN